MIETKTEDLEGQVLDLLPAIFHDTIKLNFSEFWRRLHDNTWNWFSQEKSDSIRMELIDAVSYLQQEGFVSRGEYLEYIFKS